MKHTRLITTPRAERDIDEHALFIAGDNLDAGLRFLDAIDHARNELARHPEIGAARRALERAGATVTGMSGSGPTVYGWFPDRAATERGAAILKPPGGARTIVVSSPGSDSGNWGWGVAKG